MIAHGKSAMSPPPLVVAHDVSARKLWWVTAWGKLVVRSRGQAPSQLVAIVESLAYCSRLIWWRARAGAACHFTLEGLISPTIRARCVFTFAFFARYRTANHMRLSVINKRSAPHDEFAPMAVQKREATWIYIRAVAREQIRRTRRSCP